MDVSEVKKAPLPTPEHMLGKGSLMPFNCANSGVRKLMFGTNLEQRLALLDADVPYISTGFENEFGEYSSSFEKADGDYRVVAKIPKYSSKPNGHYFIIIKNIKTHEMKYVERVSYKHTTESYGYLYNSDAVDSLSIGSIIKEGDVIRKSESFDEYNNRKDGKNLLLLFNASEYTMEDAIIISESCSKKLASPLIHKVKLVINDNDIPLNMYGNDNIYKIFPDIGESIVDGILCILRKEKKEEALFSQSFDRLKIPTVSDEKIIVSGRIVDIDIYCNAPDKLADNPYYAQINEYYQEHLAFCRDMVTVLDKYFETGCYPDYLLDKLYNKCKDELNGAQFFNERVFSNLNIDITVIEEIPVKVGDKLTNRYGGKGVVSKVFPDNLMPKTQDGRSVDIQANMCGVFGRENIGQLFEMSLNYISNNIVKAMIDDTTSVDNAIAMFLDYLELVSPKMHAEYSKFFSLLTDEESAEFISTITDDDEMLYLDIDPVSEYMTIDKLAAIYKKFPWIKQERVRVPVVDSNGNTKYVLSRRPVVCGHVYYYRLKQYGKEKFSVTSLSATNIKNENSRNKSSKVYKARYSRTPIRFGDMELGNLTHMGSELVVQLLMLYSTSPEGRMLAESMMTGSPFNIDVKLNDTASNRNVEILNTYLKTIGLKIVFTKTPKKFIHPIITYPIQYHLPAPDKILRNPIIQFNKDEAVDPELMKMLNNTARSPIIIQPINFNQPLEETNKLAKEDGDKILRAYEERMKKEEKEHEV